MYKAIFDENLPVRVQAATSIHKLLDHEEVHDLIKPGLGLLLEKYILLMDEIDCEDLVYALEKLVSSFEDDIEPYALGLTQKLSESFRRLAEVDVEQDDGEAILTSVGCITAIKTIISAVSKNKLLLEQVEDIIYPNIVYILTPDGLDSIEDGIDCISLFLKHSEEVNIRHWALFPQMIKIIYGEEEDKDVGGFGYEFLANMTPCFQNFITRSSETFLTGAQGTETYLSMTLKMISRTLHMSRESHSDMDSISAMKIIVTMIESLPEKIDQLLPTFLSGAISELQRKKISDNYRSMLIQTLSMCLHYNAGISLAILEKNEWTQFFFTKLFANLK